MPAMKDARKSTKRTDAAEKTYEGFTAEERAAMKDRGQELKGAKRRASAEAKAAEDEAAVVEKIAEMPAPDRAMAERIHAVVKASAPDLAPKLWYGMPAYARDGKVVCFFRGAHKFKTRYATLGFSDEAHLDDGAMWPTDYALTKLGAADEKRIGALVKKAVS